MPRFTARNKQTGEVIRGMWEDICDLDNRIWIKKEWKPEVAKTPLAIIQIDPQKGQENINAYFYKEIYSLNELVGLYL